APGISTSEIVDAALFTMIGAGIAWSGEQMQRNRIRAATSTRDALAREAHLASILDTVPEAMIVIDEGGIVQSFSPAAERLFGYSAAENDWKKCQDVDAVALPGESRWLHRAISADRTKANHRNRPRRGGRAQGRLDLPDGAGCGGNAIERPSLFHWLYPRHNAASAVGGEAAGAAIRARSYFAIDGDGPDGVCAGALTQPAAIGHCGLHEGLATLARKWRRGRLGLAARCPGQGGRSSFARGADHPSLARIRGAG